VDDSAVKGFCINVFIAAVELLPYIVRYTFKPYGTGNSTPNYDDLVRQVALQNFDAGIGDVAILTNR
jgi:ionotropic glutamate receptor